MFDKSATEADKIHLPTYFKTKLTELYKANSHAGHFSTPEELSEFYEDAVAILDFFKRKRGLFFTKKKCKLVVFAIDSKLAIGSKISERANTDLVNLLGRKSLDA
jgi:hypothetical protein